MNRKYHSQRDRNQYSGLYNHKIKPSFAQFAKDQQEFHPDHPCKTCFPASQSQTTVFEHAGVQDLLKTSDIPSSYETSTAQQKILRENFQSLQVHRGQIEFFAGFQSAKLFVASYQTGWEEPILSYLLANGLKQSSVFLNHHFQEEELPAPIWFHPIKNVLDGHSEVLFIDMESSDEHLRKIRDEISADATLDIAFIPVSFSYEFPPATSVRWLPSSNRSNGVQGWKPNVRINFGLPHSFKDFMSQKDGQSGALENLRKHLLHEIWKNTAIMPAHLISLLVQNRLSTNSSPSDCASSVNEFERRWRSSIDLAYIGETLTVAEYGLKVFSTIENVSPSIAVDLLKHESIMMKSLFSVMNLTEIDYKLDTCKISQKALLDQYRTMAKILRYDLEYIHPPCIDLSAIEKRALEYLFEHSVASLHSDEITSEEQQKAHRIARRIEMDFNDSEDEDNFWPLPSQQPPQDIPLYIDVDVALSRKWIANISTSLLEIYYHAAKMLLELRKVEAMEDRMFTKKVSTSLSDAVAKETSSGELHAAVKNALKLFTDEGIIDSYRHSNVTLIYWKDPLNDGSALSLIFDIAQFV